MEKLEENVEKIGKTMEKFEQNVEKIGNYGALDGFGGPFFFTRHHSAAEKSHRKVHPFSAQTSSKPQDVRWDRPSALRVRRG